MSMVLLRICLPQPAAGGCRMERSGRCPVLAAGMSLTKTVPKHHSSRLPPVSQPRHRNSIPGWHSQPGAAPAPGSLTQQRVGDPGNPPASHHRQSLFYLSLYCTTPGFSARSRCSRGSGLPCTSPPSPPWTRIPSHQRLPVPRTALPGHGPEHPDLQRVGPGSRAGRDGGGMHGAAGNTQERCHGCSIPPCPQPAPGAGAQRAAQRSRQQNVLPVALQPLLLPPSRGRRPGLDPALPTPAPKRKGEGRHLTALRPCGRSGQRCPRRGSAPEPIPGRRRR